MLPFTEVDLKREVLPFYQNSKGYVKVNTGKNRRGIFLPSDKVKDPVEGKETKDLINMGMSLGEFISPKKGGTMTNLASVIFLAVDVDFDFPGKTAEEVIEMLYADLTKNGTAFSPIPFPSFVEYGHRFRLLYALDKPYILRTRKKKRCIRFLQKLITAYARQINALNPNYHAEGQKMTSTFRPSGSINKKTAWNPAEDKPYLVCFSRIHMIHGGGHPLSIEDYASYVMQDRKDYEDHRFWKKEHEKKAKLHIEGIRGGKNYLVKRVEFLKGLQSNSCIGMRETMCWNYYNLMLSLGAERPMAWSALLDFNRSFRFPLSMREVRSSRTRKIYRMTERTFYAQFGETAEHVSDPEYDKNYSRAYRKAKHDLLEKQGKLFQQKREQKKQKAKDLWNAGFRPGDIARTLKVSRRTVYYYLKEEAKQDPINVGETPLKNCAMYGPKDPYQHGSKNRAKNASAICTKPFGQVFSATGGATKGVQNGESTPHHVIGIAGMGQAGVPNGETNLRSGLSHAGTPNGDLPNGEPDLHHGMEHAGFPHAVLPNDGTDLHAGIGHGGLGHSGLIHGASKHGEFGHGAVEHGVMEQAGMGHALAGSKIPPSGTDPHKFPVISSIEKNPFQAKPYLDGFHKPLVPAYAAKGFCGDILSDPEHYKHADHIPELPDDFLVPAGSADEEIRRALPEDLYQQYIQLESRDMIYSFWQCWMDDYYNCRYDPEALREYPNGRYPDFWEMVRDRVRALSEMQSA